jgi:hypothetical protein
MLRQAALLTLLIAVSTPLTLTACNTYRDQLVRSQRTFEQNEHEKTLGLLRAMEGDVTKLALPEQAQYAYLRGMTDYRIGHRNDARHWLAIARAHDETSTGMLPTDWKARMNEALDELNNVVYEGGITALAASRKPSEDKSDKSDRPEKN